MKKLPFFAGSVPVLFPVQVLQPQVYIDDTEKGPVVIDSVCEHKHMNILIVDDEKIELESLRRGMRCEGHTVFEALNGREAIRLLDQHHEAIDVVLTDYYMPVMNGIELLKEIRYKYGPLPVIMLTAYDSTTVKREALLNGCSAVIEKPFTMRQLSRHFQRLDDQP